MGLNESFSFKLFILLNFNVLIDYEKNKIKWEIKQQMQGNVMLIVMFIMKLKNISSLCHN